MKMRYIASLNISIFIYDSVPADLLVFFVNKVVNAINMHYISTLLKDGMDAIKKVLPVWYYPL